MGIIRLTKIRSVVDGAVGGEFMKALKKVVENPLELLL